MSQLIIPNIVFCIITVKLENIKKEVDHVCKRNNDIYFFHSAFLD